MKFWKRPRTEEVSRPEPVKPVLGWITLDENGSLFGFHETREEADDTVAYWKERGVVMRIARGDMS